MKHRGTKILAMLLTLAMVVGLMPGMSLTAYAIYEPNGLEHFIPFLDNGGNVAFYDVSIRVNDNNPNIQRTVRLLFSTLTKEQITAMSGWSNISNTTTDVNCYLSGDTNPPPHGSQITVSDVGIDTQDKTYTTPSQAGVNALNFEFSTVPLDPNKSYYVYFILRSAKGPDHTIYRMIGDSLGTLNPMKINYNKQKTDGTYDTTIVNTHYISGQYLDVSKLGTVPTGYHINTSSSTSSGNWDGTSEININYDIDVDISLTPDSTTLNVGGTQALTAAIEPSNAADKTVKWSVGGTNAGAVKLFTDEACTTEVGSAATDKLTVYAKGISAGSATVKVTSNADETKSATCTVTVTAKTYTVTVADTPNGTVTADKTTAAAGETVTLTITPDNGYELLAGVASDADNNQIPVTNNSFIMPAADVTVTVQFKEKTTPQPTTPTPKPSDPTPTPQPAANKYTVTYEANNGSGETRVQGPYEAGTSYTVEGCSFAAPEGKVFDCWKGSDGKTYKVGSPVVLNANLTLTAQWKDEEKPDDGEKKNGGSGGGFDLVFNIPGADNSWEYAPGYAPQQAYRVSLAPMQGGSAALGLTTGESTETAMNVYPTTTVYVFPNAEQGYVLDKIVWSLIDGSASYDITEAKNFVMPAMDVVVYVTFRPLG